MENNNFLQHTTPTLGKSAPGAYTGKANGDEYEKFFPDPMQESVATFKKVDSFNDAGEKEIAEEEYNFEEEEWLNDNSELTIEDFIATGEVTSDEDDEEFMDDNEDDSIITDDESAALDEAGTGDKDDEALRRSQLDSTDEEGLGLNEKAGFTGSDLDVPGAELDDDNELIGEEDEENNSYSTSGQNDNDE